MFNLIVYSQQNVPQLNTDRPDKTDSPVALSSGFVQLESGFSYEFSELEKTNYKSETFFIPSSLLRVGLIKNLELRIAGLYQVNKPTVSGQKLNINGFSDINIGAKIQFLTESYPIPASAFIIGLKLPIGSPELKPNTVEPEIIFAIARSIGKNASSSINIGVNWSNNFDLLSYAFSYSFNYSLFSDLVFFVEYYGNWVHKFNPLHNVDGGIYYLILQNFQLDISAGGKVNRDENYWFVSSGFTVRLPN
ncbi:transporter [Melioribacteraceae bacterium 4301-Me]|uniref:transporter n=1 Tax=Pyranulibacter aquaticus TaxID=3163344 RepID=UPI00359A0017